LIKERQREGIALAKAKGVYKGRKPALNAGEDCPAARAGCSRSKPDKAGEGVWDKSGDPLSIHPIGRKIALVGRNFKIRTKNQRSGEAL
jgi:hypothetical protein